MATKRGAPRPNSCTSLAQYKEIVSKNSVTAMCCFDIHQSWCGPAAALNGFWDARWVELGVDTAGEKINLYTISIDDAEKDLQDQIKADVKKADGIDSSKQGCKPLFLISRHGAPVGAVDGLNTAVLMMLVDLHVPKPEKKESK